MIDYERVLVEVRLVTVEFGLVTPFLSRAAMGLRKIETCKWAVID